jgi:protoporphyrinogen/coproporphyrinogen III oxidase
MPNKHVIVIGAGIAGLTAAWRLQQAGCSVQILEARPKVGGRMITIEWQGHHFDPGAEFVTGADRLLLQMVDELGIRECLKDYSAESTGFEVSVMRNHEVHTVNFMSIPSFFSWKAVSLGARLSMARLLPHMLRYSRTDVYHPENAPGNDGETMEEWFVRHVSREMFEYWVEPTMDVFCHYRPQDLSAKMMLIYFGTYLGQKLHTFKGGIGFLPDTLASRLQVACNARVSRIERQPDRSGAKVFFVQDGIEKALDADVVVMAAPGDLFLPMVADPEPAWQAFFSKVAFSQVGIVYTFAEGDDPALDKGGIMFPRNEPWRLAALGWGRLPDGRVHVMSDLKASLYYPGMSDEELKFIVSQEMAKAVPAFKGAIRDQMVFRWERKVPLYPPGQLKAIKTFWQNSAEKPIYFCGDYFIGSNAGAALASGWLCADRVLA